MKYKNYLLGFSLLCFLHCSAQINAVTEDGKNVVLHEDGTWDFSTADKAIEIVENEIKGCEELTSTRMDERTGLNYQSTSTIMMMDENNESNWILMDMMTSSIPSLKNVILFNLSPFGAGDCIKDENIITFQFEDGESLSLDNDAMYNCENKFMLYFGGSFKKKEELQKLTSKKLANIKIETQDGFVHGAFTNEQSTTFLDAVQCLMKSIN